MARLDLSKAEIFTLDSALRLAIEKYRDFAQATMNNPDVAQKFLVQAEETDAIRRKLIDADGV